MVIAVDGHNAPPEQVRQHELLMRATKEGFHRAQSSPTLALERRVGNYVDRMILNAQLGAPSMITRFLWDSDYPWIGKPQPTPADYYQGDAADVIDVASKWVRL